MPFSLIYATGFEWGDILAWDAIAGAGNRSGGSCATTPVRTGSFSWMGDNHWLRYPLSAGITELYQAAALRATSTSGNQRVIAVLTDAKQVRVDLTGAGNLVAYVDTTQVGSHAIVGFQLNTWYHIGLRTLIADSGGVVQVWLDGAMVIDFSGDTKPSAATDIQYAQIFSQAYSNYVDDWAIGTGGWPGDIRVDVLRPNGDSAVQFSRSAGATNASTVDEVTPSDTDYNYTEADAKDLLTLGDWDDTDKAPLGVSLYVRGKKSDAGVDDKLRAVMKQNASEVASDYASILTSYSYVHLWRLLAPDGGAWTDAKIDALLAGYEADMV